ncbi:MAG: DUF1682 domain-containing protein [Nitrosarchaeum sp.]|nr:DUF1682 domain-containing protein [Nitrosarchaeum sp.]
MDATNVPEAKRKARLEEERLRGQQELDDLERRKKELEAAAERKRREVKEVEERVLDADEALEEIEEAQDLEEEVRARRPQSGLEEAVAGAQTSGQDEGARPYGDALDQIRYGRADIYDLTDRDAYQELTQLRNRLAAGGSLSESERALVESWREQVGQVRSREVYASARDEFHYVERSSQVLKQIATYVATLPGDHQNVRKGREHV